MRSIYLIPISLAFLIFGGLIGYMAKEVVENQQPQPKDAPSWLEEVALYEDDDFLHSFSGVRDQLTPTERVLGDKLIQCIQSKKETVKQLAQLGKQTEEEVKQSQKDQSFIERFLGETKKPKQENLEGEMIPVYTSDSMNPIPQRAVDSRYRQIFPDHAFSHPTEDMFGYHDQPVDDVDAFLDKRVVDNPGMSIVDSQRKRKSKFFEYLKTAAFEGGLKIFTQGAASANLQGKMIFKSPRQNGMDWIVVTGEDGKVYETRTFAYEDESIWRYNSRNPSVILLSETCQWNNQYVYEYKDFYYLANEHMLVANIYCKKQAASKWERVGTLTFEQVAE